MNGKIKNNNGKDIYKEAEKIILFYFLLSLCYNIKG